MHPMFVNAMVGGATGICAAFIGFVGNSRNQTFEFVKSIPTLLTGIVAGALAGVLAPDYRMAIAAALGGDVLRKATGNFIEMGATPTPPNAAK